MKLISLILGFFGIYNGICCMDSVCPSRCAEETLLQKLVEMNLQMKQTLERMENKSAASLLGPYYRRSLQVKDLEADGWQMVFRATSGNGVNAYEAWATGKGASDEKPVTMERSYASHFRHRYLDNWSNFDVKYVKFALYDHDREVAYIIFNGVGSAINNWFRQTRVIASSYSDLTPSVTYSQFSIEGSHVHRRFLIATWAGCDGDTVHIATIDNNAGTLCLWDNHPAYPQFLYSMINKADYFNRRQFGRADYLAVFIKKA